MFYPDDSKMDEVSFANHAHHDSQWTLVCYLFKNPVKSIRLEYWVRSSRNYLNGIAYFSTGNQWGMLEIKQEWLSLFLGQCRKLFWCSFKKSAFSVKFPIKFRIFLAMFPSKSSYFSMVFSPWDKKTTRCSPRGTAPDAFACSAGAGRTGPHGRPGHGSGSWAASWVILELL